MRRVCFYHAGCPDGFGAAWAAWQAWDGQGRFVPRGHEDTVDATRCAGDFVAFVDIAPSNEELRALVDHAEQVVVLDHHVSALDRFNNDPALAEELAAGPHRIEFDLEHSGAMLSWRHFHPGEPPPPLLCYVEDQDLWSWKLPDSNAVNAAIASYPRTFEAWTELAARAPEELAAEGAPIVRANRIEVERAVASAHPLALGNARIEAVNARELRAPIGHELAKRANFGRPWGLVYRVHSERVDASIYSIGELDVAKVAEGHRGGGHRNAAGFSVSLEEWLRDFVV